jgi:hypothetical protein
MLDKLPNTVVRNVLTEEERSKILKDIENFENPRLNGHVGQLTFDIQLDESVISKVTDIAQEIYGGPVVLQEYNLSRYHNNKMTDREDDIIPILFPHTDFFETGRVTLDYQFRSNTSWGIVVDNKESVSEHILNDNELLSFSGTNQVHWRNKKVFGNDEFIEMIFFHFEPVGAERISVNFKNDIKDWAKSRFLEWAETPGKNSNIGTDENNIRRYDKEIISE